MYGEAEDCAGAAHVRRRWKRARRDEAQQVRDLPAKRDGEDHRKEDVERAGDEGRERDRFDNRVFGHSRFPLQRCSFLITSFSPDQTSSTEQTFTSTKCIGSATSRITSSVMSVGTFAAF